jgi:hypothetical protein
VLPAFGVTDAPDAPAASAAAEAADAALAKRLARLRIRLPATPAPAQSHESWPDTAAPVDLTPERGACEALPHLRRVRVAGRTVTLTEDKVSVELRLDDGDWHVTDGPVPVAAAGGWTGPGILEIDLLFLETPHRLSLTCSVSDGTFRARWHTRPLAGSISLAGLRAPSA